MKKLQLPGIAQAWAGSFEGILHRDIAEVNQRLADACSNRAELIPVGSINPELPDWEDDLRRYIDEYDMPGVRLHPNYHGVIVQHTWFKIGGKQGPGESTPSELAELSARYPEQKFVCAHAGGEWERGIRAVRNSPNILVETSGFDATAGFIET